VGRQIPYEWAVRLLKLWLWDSAVLGRVAGFPKNDEQVGERKEGFSRIATTRGRRAGGVEFRSELVGEGLDADQPAQSPLETLDADRRFLDEQP
jgi:hypothetical protein